MGIEQAGKPKQAYESLGPQAVVTVEPLANDRWAQNLLQDIGKTMAEPGFDYLGSVAIHFYETSALMTLTSRDGQVKNQLSLGGTTEQFVQFGVTELTKRLIAHFKGKERTSVDRRYKVKP